jgi:uncharacterized protein (TIGR02996 family)
VTEPSAGCQELLAAVLEAPDDDAPRLVYGDWLLQQKTDEQRARGEFIQVQCALARMPDEPSAERTALVRREAALLAQYELAWIDDAIPAPMPRRRRWDSMNVEWSFERGFVADYSPEQRADSVVPHLATITSKVPLQRLHIWIFDEEIEELLAAPYLEHITTLTISFSSRGLQQASKALFSTTRFRSLVDLRFGWSDADQGPPLDALLASPLVERVERFSFDWYKERDPQDLGEVAETIARSRLRDQLTALSLESRIGGRGIGIVCATPWRRLRSLSFECTDVADAVLPVAQNLPDLEAAHFEMGINEGRVRAGDVILLMEALPNLTALTLRGGYNLELDRIVGAPEAERLRELSVLHSSVGDAGALAIANAKHMTRLRVLDLAYCDLTSKGGNALANAAHLASLRHLDLRGNSLGTAAFTKSPHALGLQRLDLRRSVANNAATKKLRDRLGATALVYEDDDPATRRKR